MHSILIAITGASGSIYGQKLLREAVERFAEVNLVISPHAAQVMAQELGVEIDLHHFSAEELFRSEWTPTLAEQVKARLRYYHFADFSAPFASGSHPCGAMVIVPCSQGTLARIAHGIADNLITRAAAVMLKERQPLILVPRETPLSIIHLRNWLTLAEAGAVILPACPPFYHRPQTIDDLVQAVVQRIWAHLSGLEEGRQIRWGETREEPGAGAF